MVQDVLLYFGKFPIRYLGILLSDLRYFYFTIYTDGYAGFVFPRSSMAEKGLTCELPPVDSGYRGEIHAIISNVSNKAQTISKDTRVGQLVITHIIIADFVFDLGKERGTDAFGSSGE